MIIPPGVVTLCEKLQNANYKAYIAGGAVRDIAMGCIPKDFDVTTSATPNQVIELFGEGNVKDVGGEKYGTVLVLIDQNIYEVTTFRSESSYSDGRRPDSVEFGVDEEQDVLRRDFTINALLLDPVLNKDVTDYKNMIIIDYVDGLDDIVMKTIRCVGCASERFNEDKLRMMRAIRFAARYNFTLDSDIAWFIIHNAKLINECSPERIFSEINKILIEGNASLGINLLTELGLMKYIIPEFVDLKDCEQNPIWHPEGSVYIHTLLMLENLIEGCSPILAWSTLLHDIGKPATKQEKDGKITNYGHEIIGAEIASRILDRFNISNFFKEYVTWIISKHMLMGRGWVKDPERSGGLLKLSTRKTLCSHPAFEHLLELGKLDIIGRQSDNFTQYNAAKEFWLNPHSEINPTQIMNGKILENELGMTPGPIFGEIIKHIRELQLDEKITTKEEALAEARKYIMEHI